MSTRINRAIELLEQDQPIYYTGPHSGHVLTYEQGKKDARTWADYINVGMEHGSFDMAGLAEYMRGLVDGGPTASGHRTPAVIVELPVDAVDEASVRFNAWQMRQILGRGVHGLMLCQAESPDAVRAFVECCRYPINVAGVDPSLPSPLERMGYGNRDYADGADTGERRIGTGRGPSPEGLRMTAGRAGRTESTDGTDFTDATKRETGANGGVKGRGASTGSARSVNPSPQPSPSRGEETRRGPSPHELRMTGESEAPRTGSGRAEGGVQVQPSPSPSPSQGEGSRRADGRMWLGVGARGRGSEDTAAPVWGIDHMEYVERCDPWPLNRKGELLLGLKIESPEGVARCDEILAVPGIGYAEMGPGDLGLSLGYLRGAPRNPYPPEMQWAHEKIFAACRRNGVAFLEGATPEDIARKIDSGVRVVAGGREDTARAGRAHSRRVMPV